MLNTGFTHGTLNAFQMVELKCLRICWQSILYSAEQNSFPYT